MTDCNPVLESGEQLQEDESQARVEREVQASSAYQEYLKFFDESYLAAQKGEFALSFDTLWLGITENCNLRCVGCYVEGMFKKKYVDVGEIRQILSREARHYKCVSLTEGEAFLHPKFNEILAACREFNPDATIFVISNGTIPYRGRYREAVTLIDRLGLSIDGATKETYEAIRQGANFDRFIENVRELQRIREETGSPKFVGFSFTATRTNLPELKDVVRLAHDLGVNQVYAQAMEMKDPIIAERIRDIHISTMPAAEIRRHVSEARAVAKELKVQFHYNEGLDPKEKPEAQEATLRNADAFQQKVATEVSVRMCQYPWQHPFGLVSEGGKYNVLPCCYMRKDSAKVAAERYGLSYEAGDMKSLQQIYNSPGFWRLRQDLAAGRLHDLCGECDAAQGYRWRKRP